MFETKTLKRKSTIVENIKNDKEKANLFQNIIDLLLAAGYYRARVQSLEPFDKV